MDNRTKTLLVDASWFGHSGIGRVASEVLSRCPADWSIREIRVGMQNASFYTPLILGLNINKFRSDLFWSPGFMPPIFNSKTQPWIVTIHDLTHLHYYSTLHKLYFNKILRPLIKRASSIITVSDFTAMELQKWSGFPKEKIYKIYNGVDKRFNSNIPADHIDNPYILYVGNRRSYKNIEMLFHAFATSKIHQKGYRLAISGSRDQQTNEYERKYNLIEKVIYLGFISEDDLPKIYRNASALMFISKYEGFGLPIIEAMASGTPVITSNVSSMPEISAGAALLVDPFDVIQIAEAIKLVLFDVNKRNELIDKGLRRAQQFSWDRTAKSYWENFTKVVGQSSQIRNGVEK